jgi:hypothetical protein
MFVPSLSMIGNFLFFLRVFLLVVQHFLQPEKVFSCLLVQFLLNVFVDLDELGDDHVLQGVDSAVCYFDLLVQGQEGGLWLRDDLLGDRRC